MPRRETDRGVQMIKYKPKPDELVLGSHWLYRAKVGGERQSVNVVVASRPEPKDIGKGRKALYVDVFGYEGRWTVQTKKIFKYKM